MKCGLWRGLLFFVLWTTFSPSLFAYNGSSLPWLDTIHDFGGGGGCGERGGGGGEVVHCEL